MEVLKNKRILAVIGIVCLILGLILPYYYFSAFGFSYSTSLWGYLEGKIILVLTLVNALFIFKDFIEKFAPKLFKSNIGQKIANVKNPKLSLIPLVLIIIFVFYLNSQMIQYVSLKKGIGFYLLWVGIIAMGAHGLIYKGSNTNLAYNQNNIKNASNNQPQVLSNNGPQTVQDTSQYQSSVQNNNQQVSQSNNIQSTIQNQNFSQRNIKYCSNCGNPVDINATDCPNCKFKF